MPNWRLERFRLTHELAEAATDFWEELDRAIEPFTVQRWDSYDSYQYAHWVVLDESENEMVSLGGETSKHDAYEIALALRAVRTATIEECMTAITDNVG